MFSQRQHEVTKWGLRQTQRKRCPSPGRRRPEQALTQSSTQEEPPTKKKDAQDPQLTQTGGASIPPAKLRVMQEQITDENSVACQRMSWEALKGSTNGLINKVNISNLSIIIQELLPGNSQRERPAGQVCRAGQSTSPIFTPVYAALVTIINSKLPLIGELILKRLREKLSKERQATMPDCFKICGRSYKPKRGT